MVGEGDSGLAVDGSLPGGTCCNMLGRQLWLLVAS